MSDSKPPPLVRRVPAPPGRVKPPIPAGQSNTAAHGAGGTVRLNKRMAELGLASRREADDWIAQGWVKVNGKVAEMGMQVLPDVRIDIDKKAQGQQAKGCCQGQMPDLVTHRNSPGSRYPRIAVRSFY